MERSEAKEGVRVRYIGRMAEYLKGKLGKLETSGVSDANLAHVRFDDETVRFCNIDNLEVIEPWLQSSQEPPALSPIVVETRRYVKAGQYGNLTVYEGSAKDIRIEFTTCSHTPAQMRAAAKVLNQIAEVLEENAS